MHKLLFMMLTFLLSTVVKKILVGAGLGLASMTFIKNVFQWYIDRFVHYTNGATDYSSMVFGLLALAKIPECVSIVLGAVVARIAINAMSVSLIKK